MCYVGRLKGSMYLVNTKQRPSKDLANTKLDLRNAANSLQIEGNWGCYLGTQPHMGGRGGGETEDGTIYIYISYIYIYHIYIYIIYIYDTCIYIYV